MMLNFLKKIFGSSAPTPTTQEEKPDRIEQFLKGEINELTSADIDPDCAEKLGNFDEAIRLKKAGDLLGASALLEQSCNPPSIYSGHYRQLFVIYRQFNRDDLTTEKYLDVIQRVEKMLKYDDEMIFEMLSYWGERQGKKLPKSYFDSDRNFKITDARAYLKAASEVNDQKRSEAAKILIAGFKARKK